jgi:hypothetical protein
MLHGTVQLLASLLQPIPKRLMLLHLIQQLRGPRDRLLALRRFGLDLLRHIGMIVRNLLVPGPQALPPLRQRLDSRLQLRGRDQQSLPCQLGLFTRALRSVKLLLPLALALLGRLDAVVTFPKP